MSNTKKLFSLKMRFSKAQLVGIDVSTLTKKEWRLAVVEGFGEEILARIAENDDLYTVTEDDEFVDLEANVGILPLASGDGKEAVHDL